MTDKTIVIISDTQLPYEDRKALKAVIRFIGEYQPDEVVHIGDVMDFPQTSQWTKGTAAEHEGSTLADAAYAKKHLMEPLREVYEGPIGFHEGNHDLRPRVYVAKYAPALAGSGAFDLATLLDFEHYNVVQLPERYEFAPGWVTTHGHKIPNNVTTQGVTPLNTAKRTGKSTIMGHSHRLGQAAYTMSSGGEYEKVLWGVEVGNLMDMRKADYLKGGSANWQQGFAVAKVTGKHVQVDTISINHRRFTVDGVTFSV